MTKPTPKPLRFAAQSAPRFGEAALVLAGCAAPAAYFAAESIGRTAVLQLVVRVVGGLTERLRATDSGLLVPRSRPQLCAGQMLTVAVRPKKLAHHPISSRTGSGLARIRQEAGLSGTGSVAQKQTGALMTFSA